MAEDASMEPAPTEPEQRRTCTCSETPMRGPQWSRPRRSRNRSIRKQLNDGAWTCLNGAGPDGAGTALRVAQTSHYHGIASMEPAPTEPEQVGLELIQPDPLQGPQWSRPRRSRNSRP